MAKSINISQFPVMKGKCPTCPFHESHAGQIEIANMVKQRCLETASQICHHPRLNGKKETHLCRGARDFQIQIFHRIGFLKAETDQAWDEALQNLKQHFKQENK